MRHPNTIRTAGGTALLAAAVLLAAYLPLAPVRAASGPSLSYTVTPQAYNNTVRVANASDMLAPRIVVGPDPTGNGSVDVYAMGVDGSSCANLVTVRSTDGGQSFGAPQRAPLCIAGGGVDAVVAPNGTLLVLAAGPRVFRSFDGGASWTPGVALDRTGDMGTLAWDSVSGDVYAAWAVHVAVSLNGGATWSNASSSTHIPASVTQPSITAYGGRVVVAFTDWGTDTPNGPFGNETTGVVTSSDGGATWSAVKDLASRGSVYRVGAPSATVSRSGAFAVTWPAITWNYTTWTYVSASQDGGTSWSAAFPAAAGGATYVTFPFGRSTVFDREGRLFTTWHGFPSSGSFSISVVSSDANLTAFNESSFTVRFQSSVINSTGTENLAADNASRVFVVWEVPGTPGPYEGVYVRTVTGAAAGNVQANATTGVTWATISLRSSATGGAVRQATWTGQAFLLPELPPDQYRVWIDNGTGSVLAGSMPVQPWGQTSFTIHVSGGGVGPPPPPSHPFPWLVIEVLIGGVVTLGAGLAAVHYTRLTRETVLQRKVRLLLYEYIRDKPGASFSAVRDALGLQNGAAGYHLTVLEKQGFLHSETKRRHHFYYPNGDASLWRDLPLSGLQTSIMQAVRTTPGIGLRELGRAIGREPSSVGYNVKALAREGVLRTDRDGLRLRCYPAEAGPSG